MPLCLIPINSTPTRSLNGCWLYADKRAYHVPLRFKIIRPIIKRLFRGIFHLLGRVRIIGRENIPYGKPYVVAMNHVSIFDPPFVAAFWPEDLEIIGAEDVFAKPGQGQLLKIYGVIPVHRGDYDRSLLIKIISHYQIRFTLAHRA